MGYFLYYLHIHVLSVIDSNLYQVKFQEELPCCSLTIIDYMTFDCPNRLVTSGIYEYTRNPMYLSFALIIIGIGLMMGSYSAIGFSFLYVVITDCWYKRY